MARKRKDWTPKQGKWSQDSMEKAIHAVKKDKVGVRKAALTFSVPKSTLQRRIRKGIVNMPASRPPIFTQDEETELYDHILRMESMGFGLTIDDVCRVAFEMACEAGIPHRFNKEKKRAGYDWYLGFRQRHPDLALRKPEALSAARAAMLNPTVINDHFQKLNNILDSSDLGNKPSQIYNADETGFSLVHTPSKIIAKKGKKTVQARTSGERGENVTALICASAAGKALPPFLIFKGQRLNAGLTLNAPAETLFGVSSSSFIDAELFEMWFEKLFLKYIPPARPVLLILDGHGSHLTLSTLKLARANSVHMYCLPPHTTNHTQPLDKAVFKAMKAGYNRRCEQFMRDNPGKLITRFDFCGLFRDVFYSELSMANIVSGFKGTGIFPFNPQAIKEEYLQQSSIQTELTLEEEEEQEESHESCTSQTSTTLPTIATMPHSSVPVQPETHTSTIGCTENENPSTSVTHPFQPHEERADTGLQQAQPADDSPTPSNDTSKPSTSGYKVNQSKFASSLKKPVVIKAVKAAGKKSRRVTQGRCMTSDEIIQDLERKKQEAEVEKAQKELRKQERERKKIEQEKLKQERLAKKLLNQKEKEEKAKKAKTNAKKKVKQNLGTVEDEGSEEDPSNYCGHCSGYYFDDDSDDDDWWPCTGSCGLYWHESCTGLWRHAELAVFKCDDCKS